MSVLADGENIADNTYKINHTISPQRYFLTRLRRDKSRLRSASLTAEAALVFPIFFFFFYLLWQYFLLLLLQLSVCRDVTAIALEYGGLGYVERKVAAESAEHLSWVYLPIVRLSMEEKERTENRRVTCTVRGEGEVCVEVRYDFLCEAPLLPTVRIPVKQSFCFYPYLGSYDSDRFAEEEEKKEVVYVTENGSVYHESAACTYLNFAIRSVAASEIEQERNDSGRKYTECERCRDEAHTAVVYVTKNGLRYHWKLKCSAISRNVIEKERSEVAGMRACSRCGQGRKEEER
ncbi:MAG: hypothetical protein ACI4FZ_00525 [Lachnospiraceae bacterium]